MRTTLHKQLLQTIDRHAMAAPGDRIAVAVSGGADSVGLLRLLEDLRDELGVTLAVVHFDHALRGEESGADAAFVAALAGDSEFEFISVREDVGAAAVRTRSNLEEAGRRLRYSFFDRIVAEGRATRVAVAHTADDQAETVLARLIRGTGPAGLAAIYPVMGTIVRPLLFSRRADLREYLQARGQEWREDSSNRDVRRLRAGIRAKLLPSMERDFSPAIVSHLAELARLSREEEVFWRALVEQRFRSLARIAKDGTAILIRDLLAPLDLSTPAATRQARLARPHERPATRFVSALPLRSLTERLIRRLYEEVRGDCRSITSSHVEQVIRIASASAGGCRVELPGGIEVVRGLADLHFRAHAGPRLATGVGRTFDAPGAYEYVVEKPSRGDTHVSIAELGKRLSLKVVDWSFPPRDTKRAGEALDVDLIRFPLILRNWRPGDAYRPRGRRQPRKVKEMFLAGRIPGPERSRWPVLESAGKVIWAHGMPPAADVCTRRSTRQGMVIEFGT
ncbi:MAG: tRNA lysidine(34) synthetase TilS [Candidatus Acidiferrales bacterium]